MAAVKALQQWCKIQCNGYRDVTITNMTTSFRDGLAFCALIHKHRPDLINYDSLSKENVYNNNNLAFRVAEDQLGIPALLDAEDMVALKVPDRLSILTYVSQYYNFFHGRSPIGGMAGIKRPADGSTEEPSGKKNQPVAAKPFPSKPAAEIQTHPTIAVATPSKPSPRPTRAANEKKVLVESSNKMSSNCAACKRHVHLVQRHLVDGKLYHRNCFKCSECSNILLSGTYTTGSVPGTFTCTNHQKTPGSGLSHKNGSAAPRWLVNKNDRNETPRPSSALSTPVNSNASPRPYSPASSKASTPANAKVQESRRKFFETPPTAPADPPAGSWPSAPAESAGKSRVLLKPEQQKDKDKATALITKKLTERNGNNNTTTYQPGLRPTEFGNKLSPADTSTWNKDSPDSPRVRRLKPTEPSPPPNTAKSTPVWFKTNNKESPKSPSTFSSNIKADSNSSESPADWRSKLKPVSKGAKTTESKEPPLSAETKRAEAPPRPSPSGPAPARPTPPPTGAAPAVPPGQRTPSLPPRRGPGNLDFPNGKGSPSTNASQPEVKSPKGKPDFIPKEEIMKELQDIENSMNELEKKGIDLEKQLRRSEEEGEEEASRDELMVDWFKLIQSKQMYMRRESELVYTGRTQDLEEEQLGVEEELRRLLEKPDDLKTAAEKKREQELMEKMVAIVDDRNAIVDVLDEDRLREEEEDQQMNQLLQDLDIKKDKNKKKSPKIKKLFGWKN